jgi:hypothetical protein
MRTSLRTRSLLALVIACNASWAFAVTTQTAGHVFNSRPYLYVEAESYSAISDTDNNGWKIVSKATPITSPQGRSILPATSNVSGTAILNDIGGFTAQSATADTVTYQVSFTTAGTYQLYTRHTLFDSAATPGNFGNEDSLYISPGFNKNSSTDWLNFEGFEYNQSVVGDPNPIDGANLAGFEPRTSTSRNNGWLALRDWGVKSAGVVANDNNANNEFWNGQFYWYNRPFYVSGNDATGAFADDFGFKTQFIVDPAMVGQTVTFEVGAREDYGVIDGFLFIKDDNLDLLNQFTQAQVDAVLVPIAPNDADFDNDNDVDGEDFLIWQRGLTAAGGSNATGDANGDGAVNNIDLGAWKGAFGAATVAVSSIPEPASLTLVALGAAVACLGQRRRCSRNRG